MRRHAARSAGSATVVTCRERDGALRSAADATAGAAGAAGSRLPSRSPITAYGRTVADTDAPGPAPGPHPPVAHRILVVSARRAAGGAGDAAARAVVEQVRRRWPGSETCTVTVPRRRTGRAARRLVPVIERFGPDLVVPTDPVATAAVNRLRRRGLGVPVGLDPAPLPGPPARRPWPMRAQDAIFWYIDTPTVAQHIGAVLHLGPRPDEIGRASCRDRG